MQITEDMLDQLEAIKVKRLQNINDNGLDFEIQNSEKTVKGVYNQKDNTITFPAQSQMYSGLIVKHYKTGPLYISAIHSKAGITVVDTLPILSQIEIMAAKNNSYVSGGHLNVVGYSADSINVPAPSTPAMNTVVKRDGNLLRVTGIKRDGAVSKLTLSPLPEPPKLTQKYATPFNSCIGKTPERAWR